MRVGQGVADGRGLASAMTTSADAGVPDGEPTVEVARGGRGVEVGRGVRVGQGVADGRGLAPMRTRFADVGAPGGPATGPVDGPANGEIDGISNPASNW